MKLKLLLAFGLGFSVWCISAQSNTVQYSSKEYQSFAKIYKYTLDHPFDVVGVTQKHLKSVSISEERMQTILQAQFSGAEVNISKKESKQLQQLRKLIEMDQNQHLKKLEKFIVSQNMTGAKYDEMLKNYGKLDHVRNEVNKLSASH